MSRCFSSQRGGHKVVRERYSQLDTTGQELSPSHEKVGVQCEIVELKTAGAQTDGNEDTNARPATTGLLMSSTKTSDEQTVWAATEDRGLETCAGSTVPAYYEDSSQVTEITQQMGSSAEAEQEAGRDGEEHVPPKDTVGPLGTTYINDVEGPEVTVEIGKEVSDDEDSDPDATPEKDIVFNALSELAGVDGRRWVPVRRIQAQTSVRMELLEGLLQELEWMGVIRRDDTRRRVALTLRFWVPSKKLVRDLGDRNVACTG